MLSWLPLGLSVLISWTMAWPWPAAPSVPPVPLTVYGIVTVNGANVPLGTEVTAWCGGIQSGRTTQITIYNGASWYSNLDVSGDDADKPGKDGCTAGEMVSFEVAGVLADQTTPWQSGSLRLDLTAGGPSVTWTPTATATPSVTLTRTPTATATPTGSPAPSMTPTATPTPTQPVTATATVTPTATPTITATGSPGPSMTPTATPTATWTVIATATPTGTVTRTLTPTSSPWKLYLPLVIR